MKAEKNLQNLIIDYLNHLPKTFAFEIYNGGILARSGNYRPNTRHRPKGIPDVCCISDGSVWFLEVKTPKGKVSDAQALIHKKIENCSGNVAVVRSLEDVTNLLR